MMTKKFEGKVNDTRFTNEEAMNSYVDELRQQNVPIHTYYKRTYEEYVGDDCNCQCNKELKKKHECKCKYPEQYDSVYAYLFPMSINFPDITTNYEIYKEDLEKKLSKRMEQFNKYNFDCTDFDLNEARRYAKNALRDFKEVYDNLRADLKNREEIYKIRQESVKNDVLSMAGSISDLVNNASTEYRYTNVGKIIDDVSGLCNTLREKYKNDMYYDTAATDRLYTLLHNKVDAANCYYGYLSAMVDIIDMLLDEE